MPIIQRTAMKKSNQNRSRLVPIPAFAHNQRNRQREDSEGDTSDEEEGSDAEVGDEDFSESNEEDEVEDEQTDFSGGRDLRRDLHFGLSQLDFKGTYAITQAFMLAPNPWLTIKDLGIIGLPLSQDDARRIISVSQQDRENEMVIDADVQNTWEVKPQSVSFGNSDWPNFLREHILEAVRDGLGLTVDLKSLRLQLHALLLYGTGSYSLPRRDPPKVDGTFGTVTIILPSSYTGGEVHVSHPTGSRVLSLPSNSCFQTSILAWYVDVTHSVKPIESGYRLALSYNLVHAVPNQPTITLPVNDAKTVFLRRTLEKWHNEEYTYGADPECDLLAYILDHRYSAVDLRRGVNALKGKDANIIANLRPIAAEMGYVLLLASLEYELHKTGGPWGEEEEEITISNFVNLDGDSFAGEKNQLTLLEEHSILPVNAFSGVPDKQEQEGSMNDEDSTRQEWYYRNTLIFFHKSWTLEFLDSVGGVDYTIARLKNANPLAVTEAQYELARGIVAYLDHRNAYRWEDMTNIALSWKNLDIWKAICEKRIAIFRGIDFTLYTKALKVFSFKGLRPTIEQILESTAYLYQRLELINSISVHVPQNKTMLEWCMTQRFQAVETIECLREADIPSIIEMAQTDGILETLTSILPSFKRANLTPDFWIAFLDAIRRIMRANNEFAGEDPGEWWHFVPRCLIEAIDCWINENFEREVVVPEKGNSANSDDPAAQSAVQLVHNIISFGYPDLAAKVLETLLSTKGFVPYRFKYLFSPFISLLQQVLSRHHLSITAYPFSNFAQNIVGMYLRDVLGGKHKVILQTVMKKLGCSVTCTDCKSLDGFMSSPSSEDHFRTNQYSRNHLEQQINSRGRDVVSCYTLTTTRPHTLVVTKRRDIVAASQWPARQANAHAFLQLFGDANMMPQLMGPRARDVAMALNGTQAFQWVGPPSTSVARPVPAPQRNQDATAHTTGRVSILPSQNVAGVKRKKLAGVSQGSIIDLTLDDG